MDKQQQKNFNQIPGLEEVMGKLKNTMEQMGKDAIKIHVPKSKKEVKVNGKNSNVSLIEDGRVIFNFNTTDEAQAFYDNPFPKKKWFKW